MHGGIQKNTREIIFHFDVFNAFFFFSNSVPSVVLIKLSSFGLFLVGTSELK